MPEKNAKPVIPTVWKTVFLLIGSNIFMTFAWYAHLRNLHDKAWYVVALASWGIALLEYLLQGARQSHRLQEAESGAAQDRARSDHPVGVRAVCRLLHAPTGKERLPVGGLMLAGRSVFYFSFVRQFQTLPDFFALLRGAKNRRFLLGDCTKIAPPVHHEIRGLPHKSTPCFGLWPDLRVGLSATSDVLYLAFPTYGRSTRGNQEAPETCYPWGSRSMYSSLLLRFLLLPCLQASEHFMCPFEIHT